MTTASPTCKSSVCASQPLCIKVLPPDLQEAIIEGTHREADLEAGRQGERPENEVYSKDESLTKPLLNSEGEEDV